MRHDRFLAPRVADAAPWSAKRERRRQRQLDPLAHARRHAVLAPAIRIAAIATAVVALVAVPGRQIITLLLGVS